MGPRQILSNDNICAMKTLFIRTVTGPMSPETYLDVTPRYDSIYEPNTGVLKCQSFVFFVFHSYSLPLWVLFGA